MASRFKIESGIPVPSPKDTTYPWAEMVDGDSFFIAATGDERRAAQRRVYTTGRSWLKRNRNGEKARIATRIEENGVRVWMEVS